MDQGDGDTEFLTVVSRAVFAQMSAATARAGVDDLDGKASEMGRPEEEAEGRGGAGSGARSERRRQAQAMQAVDAMPPKSRRNRVCELPALGHPDT
jgi:hypothetical protein